MKAEKISLENAKENKLFYFVANLIIYRESDKRCLILKRSSEEKVHPDKYCVPGGKLEGENFDLKNPTRMNGDVYDFENTLENLLRREVREESGLEVVNDFHYINSVGFVRPDGIPVMMQKFTAKYLSGEVELEQGAFTSHVWVNREEVENYDCIGGIKGEIIKAIDLFDKL
ncbi:MAG: NUDIX domain-containing protein [Candidatus Falkowbacteria bacterium]|nr:NUDIX domain-containing protein [Candidatus Falkowbacteria bacterium]